MATGAGIERMASVVLELLARWGPKAQPCRTVLYRACTSRTIRNQVTLPCARANANWSALSQVDLSSLAANLDLESLRPVIVTKLQGIFLWEYFAVYRSQQTGVHKSKHFAALYNHVSEQSSDLFLVSSNDPCNAAPFASCDGPHPI